NVRPVFRRDVIVFREILNLARDAHGEFRRIESCDRADSAFARAGSLPKRFGSDSVGADDTHPSDAHAAFHERRDDGILGASIGCFPWRIVSQFAWRALGGVQ